LGIKKNLVATAPECPPWLRAWSPIQLSAAVKGYNSGHASPTSLPGIEQKFLKPSIVYEELSLVIYQIFVFSSTTGLN